jgi:putative transposase
MLERLNEEIKRRTRVVKIFPNQESCLRLIRALAVETHEGWLEEHRYLNMDLLVEHKRELLRQLEEAAQEDFVKKDVVIPWSAFAQLDRHSQLCPTESSRPSLHRWPGRELTRRALVDLSRGVWVRARAQFILRGKHGLGRGGDHRRAEENGVRRRARDKRAGLVEGKGLISGQ